MNNETKAVRQYGNFRLGMAYPKYLFHRTALKNLEPIMQSNKLIAGTRSRHEDVRVSMSVSSNGTEFGTITFVIDAEKLREDYEVHEFDYDRAMSQYAYEKEWYTDTDILDLSKYVVDITSDCDESCDRLRGYSEINKAVKKISAIPFAEELDEMRQRTALSMLEQISVTV